MKVFVGVDCGATNLRVGIFNEDGDFIAFSKTTSPLKDHPNDFALAVRDQLNTLVPEKHLFIKAIGVGTPGPLNLDKGWILTSPNLGNKEPIDLHDQFLNEFHAPLFIDRDTNLALLGESWQGAAVDVKDVVMLTLGTGVGGAVMVDGHIEHGSSGKAGEIGHMFLPGGFNGPVCGLGHKGCFEALMNSTKDMMEMAQILGLGLANIVDIFNPQKIIIGGGKISYILPSIKHRDLLTLAADIMKKMAMKEAASDVEITYAKLEDTSGVYGAAKLAMEGVKG